jgi:hypothetical protein
MSVDAHNADEMPPQPLHLYERSSRSNFADYTTVVERLSAHTQPGNLSLYLIFRVACFRMRDDILQPLLRFARLRYCGLWSFVGIGVSTIVCFPRSVLAGPHLLISDQSSQRGTPAAMVR